MADPINLSEKFASFDDQWSPKIIARMNDYHFKLAKIRGEFVWHSHPETDEVFIVIQGSMTIQMPEMTVRLQAGEMFVVPRGMQHRPVAHEECHIMLVEPVGTLNTGDAGGDLTAEDVPWI